MAYLFQSGSMEAQLSGGMDFNYSNVETDKMMAINSDANNPTEASGTMGFGAGGAGSDGALYWDGSALCVAAAGAKTAHFDGDGLDLVTGDAYLINNASVLNATTLGAGVLASSLTSVGTITSLVATTADINAGTVDAVIGGTTPAAGSFTTISGSSTLIVDGAVSLNSSLTIKPAQNITLGVSGDNALDVAADGLYFADATDGYVKTISIGSFLTDIAGVGLSVVSNQLEAAGTPETVNNPIGNENATLFAGMNWGTSSFNANRVWTLPACSTLNKGDILRIKAPALGGNTLTVSPNAVDAIDDLADNVDVELMSDNASISLMVVSGAVTGLLWKII